MTATQGYLKMVITYCRKHLCIPIYDPQFLDLWETIKVEGIFTNNTTHTTLPFNPILHQQSTDKGSLMVFMRAYMSQPSHLTGD